MTIAEFLLFPTLYRNFDWWLLIAVKGIPYMYYPFLHDRFYNIVYRYCTEPFFLGIICKETLRIKLAYLFCMCSHFCACKKWQNIVALNLLWQEFTKISACIYYLILSCKIQKLRQHVSTNCLKSLLFTIVYW